MIKKFVLFGMIGLFSYNFVFANDEVYIKDCKIVHKNVKYYENIVSENQNDVCSYYNLATEYYKKGNIQKFLDNMNIILDINPKDTEVYFRRAHIYWLYKNHEKFYAEFARAIKQNPDYAIGHQHVAQAYEKILDYDNALKHINLAIELTKEPNAYLFYFRARLFDDIKRYDDAITDYTKAIELDPSYDFYYHLRGDCYRKIGKTAEAEQDKAMYDKLQKNYKRNVFREIKLNLFVLQDHLFYTKMLL